MISPYFPPRKRVGSQRAFKFASNLRQFGYLPCIVCLDTGAPLSEEEQKLLEGIPVLKIKPPFDTTGKKSSSQLDAGSSKKSGVSQISDQFDSLFPVDTWLPVLMYNLASVHEFAVKNNVSLVWSTGDPWSSHVLASLVKSTLGLPWISDWRDPWSICRVRNVNKPWITRQINAVIEAQLMEKSDHLIFTASGTAKPYQLKYTLRDDKVSVIYNSFDADRVPVTQPTRHVVKPGVLDMLFFGRFRQLSPVSPVIKLLNRIKSIEPGAINQISITSFGNPSETEVSVISQYGFQHVFRYEPPVYSDLATQRLQAADLLLLSTDEHRDDIIPAKLWEYMPIGTPIFSIAPNPEIETILTQTGSGTQFPPDSDQAAHYIINVLKSLQSGTHKPVEVNRNEALISSYSSREATRALGKIFDRFLHVE